MKTKIIEITDACFGETLEKERLWELLSAGGKEGEDMQLLFDLRSYCLMQRLLLEKYKEDPEGKKAALLLFPLPAKNACYRDRVKETLAYEWTELWFRHREETEEYFAESLESKKTFLWSLLNEADDYAGWMEKRITDPFVRKSAEDCYPRLTALIKNTIDGFVTPEELLNDLKEDGYTPELPYYLRMEKLIRDVTGNE